MLGDNNFHILTQTKSLKLAQDKIDDRQNLLKLPSHEAQAIANRIIIDPALWKPDFSSGFEFNSLSLTDDEFED
jgi:hypothetical protein